MTLKLLKDEPAKERRCENWLQTFTQYTEPRSESPSSILLWTGLFTLASVVRRNVGISKDYLGGWSCYPSIFVIFVGPQGSIKKSTSIDFGVDLLDEVKDELQLSACPEAVTSAELAKRLMDAKDSSVYMVLSEFGLLPRKAGDGIYDILTRLFDGAKKIDESTIGRGYIFASNPCLNMLAATTPSWINENISSATIGGGFGSRVIFIGEDTVRQREIFYMHVKPQKSFEEIHTDLLHDLSIIGNIKGSFTIAGSTEPDDAEQPYGFFRQWYKRNSEPPKGTDPRMLGFYNRKPAHVLKSAMLWHLSYSNDLELSIGDLKQGIRLVDDVEPKVLKTFQSIGKHTFIADIKSIGAFIKENGTVYQKDILSTFMYSAEPYKLAELIQIVIDCGDATKEWDSKEKDWKYAYTGD